jgi:peptide deformylase
MALRDIRQLGDPVLYQVSEPVLRNELRVIPSIINLLHESMMEFREVYKVGRAIAAPQVGVLKRLIYMNIEKPVVFINPVITEKSKEMIELWDDCMCFPNLLVRVKRHQSIIVKYYDMNWEENTVSFQDDLSELFQHEYDHLDGILATERAIDTKSFKWRE